MQRHKGLPRGKPKDGTGEGTIKTKMNEQLSVVGVEVSTVALLQQVAVGRRRGALCGALGYHVGLPHA